jgi:hypothetical protein
MSSNKEGWEGEGGDQSSDRVVIQDTDALSEAQSEGQDTFYEEMFYNFAADPDDEHCTYTYWTDGIGIEREWADGKWQYFEVRAK